ncbi:TonB-dependent siderophore receptor [Vibrio vulnificus]|nr:TonB-dependent siderophore receptor [Vibrio vulnificus]
MEHVKYHRFTLSLLSYSVALGMSSGAMAQENSAYDPQTNERQIVWGTTVSSNTESMASDDMSLKQADHMSDLLRDIPGVDVGGTHSVNQRITIRGLGETDLDIRLDGASQHANMFHHIGNLTLNPDILKSAMIQVGNNSVVQNGLGGSVFFETKDARDLLRYGETIGARVFADYQTNDSQQGSLTAYGLAGEQFDWMLYGNYLSRDDFKDGEGTTSFGSAGDVYNILAKVGFEPSERHRLELTYDLYRDKGDYRPRPDMSGSANQGLSQEILIPTQYDRDTVTLGYELLGEQHKGRASLYSSKTEITRDESVIPAGRWPANRLSENVAQNRNTGLNAQFIAYFNGFGLENATTYGLDYMDKRSSATYGGSKYMEESADSLALFVENQLWITKNWSVTGGLRWDDYTRDAVNDSREFDDVTWALATEWQATEQLALFASTRSLFKGPELMETFIRAQHSTYLTDDLKAETGQNTQGGVKYRQAFGEHSVAANITVFDTQIDDYIAESYQGATRSYLVYNLGDVEIKGFEAAVTYGYDAINAKLSYAKSDMKNKQTGGPVAAGNGRSMDMGDSIALTLDYYTDSLDLLLGWSSIVVLEEDNVFEGTPVKEGYDVHNLYAQWLPQQVEGLTITFGVDNILDESYTSHASRSGFARGYKLDDYEPGRNVKLSAAYQF